MTKFYVYNIYNLLRIASNRKSDRIFDVRFIDSEVEIVNDSDLENLNVDVVVHVAPQKRFEELMKNYFERYPSRLSFSYAIPNDRSILHYQRFLGSSLGVYLHNLEGMTRIIITDALFRFKFSIPLRELLVPEDLGYVYLIKLLQRESFIIHGALLNINDHIVSLVGMPDVGKTLTSVELALERKAKIYSDDMTIVCSNGKAYGLPPRSIGLGTLSEKPLLKLLKLRRLKSLFYNSFIRYISWLPYVPINVGKNMLISIDEFNKLCGQCIDMGGGIPDYLIILEVGGTTSEIKCLDTYEAKQKILYASMREWYYFDTNPLLLKYAYANPSFSFLDMLKMREQVIENFIRQVPNLILMRGPSSKLFKEIIWQMLKGHA